VLTGGLKDKKPNGSRASQLQSNCVEAGGMVRDEQETLLWQVLKTVDSYSAKSSGDKPGKECLNSLHFCAVAIEIRAKRRTENTKEHSSEYPTDFWTGEICDRAKKNQVLGGSDERLQAAGESHCCFLSAI